MVHHLNHPSFSMPFRPRVSLLYALRVVKTGGIAISDGGMVTKAEAIRVRTTFTSSMATNWLNMQQHQGPGREDLLSNKDLW